MSVKGRSFNIRSLYMLVLNYYKFKHRGWFNHEIYTLSKLDLWTYFVIILLYFAILERREIGIWLFVSRSNYFFFALLYCSFFELINIFCFFSIFYTFFKWWRMIYKVFLQCYWFRDLRCLFRLFSMTMFNFDIISK